MMQSRYYFTKEEEVKDPQQHARNLRSLLIMAEHAAAMAVIHKEYLGDKMDDFQQSLDGIKKTLSEQPKINE